MVARALILHCCKSALAVGRSLVSVSEIDIASRALALALALVQSSVASRRVGWWSMVIGGVQHPRRVTSRKIHSANRKVSWWNRLFWNDGKATEGGGAVSHASRQGWYQLRVPVHVRYMRACPYSRVCCDRCTANNTPQLHVQNKKIYSLDSRHGCKDEQKNVLLWWHTHISIFF